MPNYLDVVLNMPLNQTFTYATNEKTASAAAVGKRAEVYFGNRLMTAFIVAVHETLPENLAVTPGKIKPIQRLIDKDAIFTGEQVALSNWISRYYLCSPGEALSAMIPSGRRETGGIGFAFELESPDTTARVLSVEQRKAVRDILEKVPDTGLHYLFGATGSGKTEVFLQIAEETLKAGKGVIYLVPEIALTHQVVQAVGARFGKTVAALHSALTPSERLGEWRRILRREARVVIGARSAVFAPVPDLGLIIIDEEHDGSYKSGSTPRYHARQVAMKRC
jgi:primosomal protein N' (replication factor Y)